LKINRLIVNEETSVISIFEIVKICKLLKMELALQKTK
jgi:hypothetical protein